MSNQINILFNLIYLIQLLMSLILECGDIRKVDPLLLIVVSPMAPYRHDYLRNQLFSTDPPDLDNLRLSHSYAR